MASVNKIIQLNSARTLNISVANSRLSTNWQATTITWEAFVERLKAPIVTTETMAVYDEYKNSSDKALRAKADIIKDVGGYVGGRLAGKKRGNNTIESRSLLTLDIDYATMEFLDELYLYVFEAYFLYSTKSHRDNKPRFRLVLPMARETTPEEYEAISRKFAETIGIDLFDDTTYQPSRLMYWPSISSDQEYIFRQGDGPWVSPDEILAKYGSEGSWKDQSRWPVSSRIQSNGAARHNYSGLKAVDPTTKPGIIGAFCRLFSIEDVISNFLSDVYEAGENGRYTFVGGSTTNGAVIYKEGNGTLLTSHHSTDPAGGNYSHNSFDLLRIHKFGNLDIPGKVYIGKSPSFKAMMDFLENGVDPDIQSALRTECARADFPELPPDKLDFIKSLKKNAKGGIDNLPENVIHILRNDPNLQGKFRLDLFANNVSVDDAPWKRAENSSFWNDSDNASLRNYLSRVYGIAGKDIIADAFTEFLQMNAYNPVKEYLEELPKWDEVERIDTLLIDYFAAENTALTKAITRKTLISAVARIMQPGCKVDTVLILKGAQGLGKSKFFSNLVGEKWFSDNLPDVHRHLKDAKMGLRGNWIVELGELSSIRKSSLEEVKNFITTREDKLRLPYASTVSSHKRQSILTGSTNEDSFLTDETGSRRFWPIECHSKALDNARIDEIPAIRDQLWAEALFYYNSGEKWWLDPEQEAELIKSQEAFREESPFEELIISYLDKLLPSDWYNLSVQNRVDYLNNDFTIKTVQGTLRRDEVSLIEIWRECLGRCDIPAKNDQAYREIKAAMKAIGWSRAKESTWISGYNKTSRKYKRPHE